MTALAMSGGLAASGRYTSCRVARRGANGVSTNGTPGRVPVVGVRGKIERSMTTGRSRSVPRRFIVTRAVEPETATADEPQDVCGDGSVQFCRLGYCIRDVDNCSTP